MTKFGLTLTVLFGLVGCTPDSDKISDKNTLLTSANWSAPLENTGEKNLEGTRSFNEDGTYIENFAKEQNVDKIILLGTWKWVSESEISILCKSMSINGENHTLDNDEGDRYILRITELTKENLKVVERHVGNSENSGFAKNLTYVASAK